MAKGSNTKSKRTKSPLQSILQSASAEVMKPRLYVFLASLVLVAVGIVMVYSASSVTDMVESNDPTGNTIKQLGFAILGYILIFFCVKIIPSDCLFGLAANIFYVGCLILMVATTLFGTEVLGAKRWIYLGPVGLQPSEFLKIALVFMATKIICQYNNKEFDFTRMAVRMLIYVLVPIGFLVITQRDLGSTVICFAALVAVLWLSGMKFWTVFGLFAIGFFAAAIFVLIEPYRLARLMTFMDPWSQAQGEGYQLVGSFKALGAGGFLGVGLGESHQKLMYLPEAETDFIFAIVGEEFGFVGAIFVIAMFLVILYGGMLIARAQSDDFGLILAAALTGMLVFQAFLNIACVTGLFPTTGKPLPFLSSGGSSMISSLLMVGLILAISHRSDSSQQNDRTRKEFRVLSQENRRR